MIAIGWISFRRPCLGFVALPLFLLTSLLFSSMSFAQDITVFDVRNTLPLSDEEPVYKDYYLNAGSVRGLREGMIITVVRRVSLYDSYQNKSAGEMQLEVGKIKLIHVQKDLAVARDYSSISRAGHPLLDYDFVMMGDALDLESMTTESKSKSAALGESPQKLEEIKANPVEIQVQKTAEPQARRIDAGFAIDFASKAAPLAVSPTVAPLSTLQ